MNIRKTVIPAAGLGTRMLPAAKAIPKEMLPILDRPTIQFVLEEAAEAGINDAILITSRHKRAIEDHFSPNPELEDRLRAAGRSSLLDSIQKLCSQVQFHFINQPQQRGLGDAVLQARDQAGTEPFLCQLGDAIFSGDLLPARQLVDAHQRFGTSIIGLEEVSEDKVSRYGIVGGMQIEEGVWKLDSLVEKPSKETAPSRLAIAARYILTPAIFPCLSQTKPGVGGEIQLTDGLKLLLEREPIHGVILKAKRHDIGNPLDWLRTNLIFASRAPEIWKNLDPLLRTLLGAG
ncbi:MAG TPA: UTP--glucose-1-phosphate uridylyltransferase [Tepidisphaeraceae bacterium]|jgi:UTP--glucose-1-phosphate uridylyltransferase|nr:UTP--glucose-1-phosphate uridylyltransferase [Tepidisphaeraceae bacterium]HEV8607472.1 UTP--glucose-1-phosphate uridylyltransferase [Tepidisphaeraceae bacterium]